MSTNDPITRSAFATWPPTNSARTLAEPAAPSREVGIRYAERVRWGRFVGFEADDRGLLVNVDFGESDDAETFETVTIDRVVGLEGTPIERAAGLAQSSAALQTRITELEVGCERIADEVDYASTGDEAKCAAANLRSLAGKTVR